MEDKGIYNLLPLHQGPHAVFLAPLTAMYMWNITSPKCFEERCLWRTDAMIYFVCSIWWYSRLRRTILAKIFASSGAVAAAAAPRRTLAAPAFCMRLAWCPACRPPGIVNCNWKISHTRNVRIQTEYMNEKQAGCYSHLEKSKCCTRFQYRWWISEHSNKSSNFRTTEEQTIKIK